MNKIMVRTSAGWRKVRENATVDEVCDLLQRQFMAGRYLWYKIFVDGKLYEEMER